MERNSSNNSKLYTKIKNINNSINKMMGCVKHLEKMRSFNYLSSVNEEELKNVLEHMKQIEKSLEKINETPQQSEEANTLFKAIGKNRKLIVSKQEESKGNTHSNHKNETNKDFKSNPITLNTPSKNNELFDKEITPESYHAEAKKRSKDLLFKNNK